MPFALNEADSLRQALSRAEYLMASASSASEFGELLSRLDVAARSVQDLGRQDADLRAENARLESLISATQRRAHKIVRGIGGIEAYRRARPTGARAAWWELDALLAAERARRLRTLGAACVVLALLIGAVYVFRDSLFPVNPVRDAITDAEVALRDNRPVEAVAAIDRGLELTPTNGDLNLWRGVLAELQGDKSLATMHYGQAANSFTSRALRIERSQAYLRAGLLEGAAADLEAIISTGDTGADSYFLRASVWEARRDAALRANDIVRSRIAYQNALADLEKAAALAEQSKQDALVATSRMRMAMLLQQAGP